MILRIVNTFLLSLLLSTNAIGAPLSYDELIGGDLNGQLLNLDTGTNTIAGSWTLEWPSTQDYDPFFFNVPNDTIVTSVNLIFNTSGLTFTDGYGLSTNYIFLDSTPQRISNLALLIPIFSSPQQLPADDLPLVEGTYRLVQTGAFNVLGTPTESLAIGDGGTIPYTWTFNVESLSTVPIPAAVWLFSTALIGLVGFGKRRKAV
jgi:hypothetical protein